MSLVSLDPTKQQQICTLLALGSSRAAAARAVGCHAQTIVNTARRDPEFAKQVLAAESRHELGNLKHISDAASDVRHWRAAAWILERMYPERYGPRGATTVTPLQVSEALDRFAEIICQELPEPEDRRRILTRLKALTKQLGRMRSSAEAPPGDTDDGSTGGDGDA